MAARKLIEKLAREAGLTIAGPDSLTITREKRGTGFCFRDGKGTPIEDRVLLHRLKAQAVPPAYRNVRYAADPTSHLQAVGEDAAGRLQYRYHPDWTKVREVLKARRLAGLAKSLANVRRAVARSLRSPQVDRRFAVAAVIELVNLTAIRAGSEAYARDNGTRGATTLLKSNIQLDRNAVTLTFKAKGGQKVTKTVTDARFARVIQRLKEVPGRRLFQYRDNEGTVRAIRASDVNAVLKTMAGCPISLKDFRTLTACANVLETLVTVEPAASATARRGQVRRAVEAAAEELANTPVVCRKSYVHEAVVTAFEEGRLKRFGKQLKAFRSSIMRAEILAKIIVAHSA